MSILDEVKHLAKVGFRGQAAAAAAAEEPEQKTPKEVVPEGNNALEGLWDPPKEGEASAVASPPVTISGALTPDKLKALADSQDFSGLIPEGATESGLTPEQVTAVAKEVYMKALQHGGTLADGLVTAKTKELEDTVAVKVQHELVKAATDRQTQSLPKEADPIVQLVSQQIQSKYSGAPAEWVADQTTKYIKDVAAGINKSVEESVGTSESVSARGGRRPTGNPPFPAGVNVQARENPKNWLDWLAQD